MRFTIRVYFLLFDESRTSVLVSDERIAGNAYTKFPGGGLEWGEGTADCALREAREELGQDIELTGHFYTTDFFVASAFHHQTQVISIYYTARLTEPQRFRTSELLHDFRLTDVDEESFRWVPVSEIREDQFSFPIDQKVAGMLRQITG
jgi:ADP-ribose pyrophosphatase YjhB (NUDIX family)